MYNDDRIEGIEDIKNRAESEFLKNPQAETITISTEAVHPFPKMLYNHPIDKTKEARTIVVNTKEEADAAIGNGYKEEPHVPVAKDADEYEAKFEVDGSGSERYGNADFAGEDDPYGVRGEYTEQSSAEIPHTGIRATDSDVENKSNETGTLDSLSNDDLKKIERDHEQEGYQQGRSDRTSSEIEN